MTSRRDVLIAGAGMAAASLALPRDAAAQAPETCCPVVELRQYTLHPGKRDVLIDLFGAQFIESQETVGARLIGQFRDLDDPDRFVWLRGFPDMPSRAQSLAAFYDGPVWKAHRGEANATINDSDNVLLLCPARAGSGFPAARLRRPPAAPSDGGVVMASIHYVDADQVQPFADFFETAMQARLETLGLPVLAAFASETSENTFKRLPVREHDHVFVWFSSFPNLADCDRSLAGMRRSQTWREGATDPILHQLARKPEVLRLAPTSRSALRA